MKLNSILIEQIRYDNKILLENVIKDLLPQQKYIIEGIYKELTPLIEASLDAAQIKSLFGEIEKQSIAGGKSRTLVGGAIDVGKKANDVINNVGKWLQDTTPVKMADQKFENLKAKIGEKFPELDKNLTNFGTWMKENPGKSAAIIGVLTAVASIAGGPVGGAIAGQILRGSAELLKGEKISTALGKGIKTAVLGFITGAIADNLGNWLSGLRAEAITYDDGLTRVTFKAGQEITAPGFEWTRNINLENITVLPEDRETVIRLVNEINDGSIPAFDKLYNIAKEITSDDYKDAMAEISQVARQAALDNDRAFQALEMARKGITAAAQGSVAAAGVAKKQESLYLHTRPLSEGQVYILFDNIQSHSQVQPINESPMDALKKAGGAIAKGSSWLGKQATEKITSAKLMASWKLEGSPTDSEELAKFLKGQGVEDAVIDAAYTDMNLPKPGSAASEPETTNDIESVKQMVSKLDTQRKARLLKQLLGKNQSIDPNKLSPNV